MKALKLSFCPTMNCLIAFLITLIAFETFGQENKYDLKKKAALKKITMLRRNAPFNQGGIIAVEEIAEKATRNFDTYVHVAELMNEFSYHTESLFYIAKYASKAKVESDYFRQLADLVLMKLSNSQKIIEIALTASKLGTPTKEEIEKDIKEIENTAGFKTLDEARAYNQKLLSRRFSNRVMRFLKKGLD
jgi:hypothetical protein